MGEVLAIDIGGSKVKFRVPSDPDRRFFVSGRALTAQQMVDGVKAQLSGWKVDRITIGIPAPVKNHRPVHDPVNLGKGWTDFDYDDAFGMPVKMINDAAMQAVGGYVSGTMLFLGLGTGLGSALIANNVVIPTELAHLPYKNGRTFEQYLGTAALEKAGKRKWRRTVADVCEIFRHAFNPDSIVIGGGNARLLKELPEGCALGENSNAFVGGFRLWEPAWARAFPASMPSLARAS
jgi:polyphosphate glucokinase